MDAADDDNAGTALYAPHQTSLYIAPPVTNGQIPKNVYGNLDIYVPSMISPGGTHISHPETARAARILGIEYADAVTGFSFKGRHGTAITSGAVVAAEYREAVETIIEAFEDERAQAEAERRSLAALKMWKRFLAGLRIRERIEGYDVEGERDTAMKYEMEKAEDEDEGEGEGGGFLPDRDADEPAQPTAKIMTMRRLPGLANDDEGGGFSASEDEQEETEASYASDRFVNRVNDDDENDDGGILLTHQEQDTQDAMGDTNDDEHENAKQEGQESAGHLSPGIDGQDILGHGGGFLPDGDDPEDDNPPTDEAIEHSNPDDGMLENPSSIDPGSTPQNKENSEEAFPDLAAGELEEARILQQLYEPQGSEHSPVIKTHVPSSAPNTLPELPPMQETRAGGEWETSAQSRHEPIAVKDSEPDSSGEDKGSLLSHDPDDEDADPEWLA